MFKKPEDQTRSMTEYVCWLEKRDSLKNIFFEPIGNTKSSREHLMLNLVTTLINNGFKPNKEVEHWYAEQLKHSKK